MTSELRSEEVKDLEKNVLDRGNSKGKIAEAGKSLVVQESKHQCSVVGMETTHVIIQEGVRRDQSMKGLISQQRE